MTDGIDLDDLGTISAMNHALYMTNDRYIGSLRKQGWGANYKRYTDEELRNLKPEEKQELEKQFIDKFGRLKDDKYNTWQDVIDAVNVTYGGEDGKGAKLDKDLDTKDYFIKLGTYLVDIAHDKKKHEEKKLAELHQHDGKWAAMNHALAGANGFGQDAAGHDAYGYISGKKVEDFTLEDIHSLQAAFKNKYSTQIKAAHGNIDTVIQGIEALYALDNSGKANHMNSTQYIAALDSQLQGHINGSPTLPPASEQANSSGNGSNAHKTDHVAHTGGNLPVTEDNKKLQLVLVAMGKTENYDSYDIDGKVGRLTRQDADGTGLLNADGTLNTDKINQEYTKRYHDVSIEQAIAIVPTLRSGGNGTQLAGGSPSTPPVTDPATIDRVVIAQLYKNLRIDQAAHKSEEASNDRKFIDGFLDGTLSDAQKNTIDSMRQTVASGKAINIEAVLAATAPNPVGKGKQTAELTPPH